MTHLQFGKQLVRDLILADEDGCEWKANATWKTNPKVIQVV
jgi:hypothetical protein